MDFKMQDLYILLLPHISSFWHLIRVNFDDKRVGMECIDMVPVIATFGP